jgi:hypothetical protein
MGIFQNLTKWQNYLHYLLLSGSIFVIHWLSDIWGIEGAAIAGGAYEWVLLWLFYAAGIFVADTLIHILFTILPEPLKWED